MQLFTGIANFPTALLQGYATFGKFKELTGDGWQL
jgi:hypothetical protein